MKKINKNKLKPEQILALELGLDVFLGEPTNLTRSKKTGLLNRSVKTRTT